MSEQEQGGATPNSTLRRYQFDGDGKTVNVAVTIKPERAVATALYLPGRARLLRTATQENSGHIHSENFAAETEALVLQEVRNWAAVTFEFVGPLAPEES